VPPLAAEMSGQALDELDDFVAPEAVVAGEFEEVPGLGQHRSSLGVPATLMPRPRRNSSRPSSLSMCSARRTVFLFTPSTAAKSLARGRRSPGLASPSAMARRIRAAT
jgi:hypothetical protein